MYSAIFVLHGQTIRNYYFRRTFLVVPFERVWLLAVVVRIGF
jgi:hypothetical protein